jgi:hypothetical protein
MTAKRRTNRSSVIVFSVLVVAAALLPGCGAARASHGDEQGERLRRRAREPRR